MGSDPSGTLLKAIPAAHGAVAVASVPGLAKAAPRAAASALGLMAGALGLAVCSLGLAGCGYSFTRLLPSQYRTIYVEPFVNEIPITEEVSERLEYRTNIVGLEEKVTRAVINRFLLDGSLRITTKPEQGDLLLDGEILDFYRQDVRKLDDDTVEEYRLNLVAALRLKDKSGNLLFDDPNLIADTTFFLTGASAKSESVAVEDLITDFSRRVVERVVEQW